MKDLLIVWNDLDNLGIPIIDEQHRALVSMHNSLYHFLQNKQSKEALPAIINTLRESLIIHALTEEGIMERVGYPNLKEHKKIHEELNAKTILANYKTLLLDDDPAEIIDVVKDYWLTHLHKEDRAYVPYVADYMEKRTLR